MRLLSALNGARFRALHAAQGAHGAVRTPILKRGNMSDTKDAVTRLDQAESFLEDLLETYDNTEWIHEAAYYAFMKRRQSFWERVRAFLAARSKGDGNG